MIPCDHLGLWRGTCVDCLEDVTWPDVSTVDERQARTRRAFARTLLRLRVYGTTKGHRA